MPSHKLVKTYQKKTRAQQDKSSNSVEAINALFAQNLKERLKCRKKTKIKLKELPPRIQSYISDESLHVEPNNTFDKLRKGQIYNPVNICNYVKINSSSETTKSSVHSPIMTRSRKKTSAMISEVSDKSTSLDKPGEKSSSLDKPAEKSSTLDKPVTSSLLVEKEHKQISFPSLSYIKLPKIAENEVVSKYQPIFSETFRERQLVHSSTPCLIPHGKQIVADSISPITKSDSSNSTRLTEKSYDHIRKWDENFPKEDTPVRNSPRRSDIKGRRRKFLTNNDDWKLDCSPKVYLRATDWRNETRAEIPEFRGFTEEEQTSSREESMMVSNLLSSLSLEYRRAKRRLSKVGCDSTEKGRSVEKTPRTPRKSPTSRVTTRQKQNRVKFSTKSTIVSSTSTSSLDNSRTRSLRSWTTSSGEKSLKISFGSGKAPPKRGQKGVTSATNSRNGSRKKSTSCKTDSLKSQTPAKSPDTRTRPTTRATSKLPPKTTPKAEKVTHPTNTRSQKPSVDVTDDILSEKEMSYSNSFSFDVSAEDHQTADKEKEKKSEEEPNIFSVDLQKFESFVQNHYSPKGVEKNDVSVITVSDDSVSGSTPSSAPIKSVKKKEPSAQLSLTTPPKPSSSKIIVLSNISLGRSHHSRMLDDSIKRITHDHSYTCSPLPQSTPLQTRKSRTSPTDLSEIIESSMIDRDTDKFVIPSQPPPLKHITMRPGKCYRRSLSLLRRSSVLADLGKKACPIDCLCVKCVFRRKLDLEVSRTTSQIVPVRRSSVKPSLLESYANSLSYVQGEDYIEILDESVRSLSLNARSSIGRSLQVTAKDVVLRRCGQTEVLRFDECYPPSSLQNCQKIGEGVYGEVFLYRNENGGTTVMKVIPIEGDLIVNGDRQKKFEEILSEIIIAMELSNLRNNKKNTTTTFSEVQRVRCTQGNYPDRLLDLWDLYDETRGSENDSPRMFPSDQLYIVLELANSGKDLESFVFNNAVQVYAMFMQTACALAVAEEELKFEHRDLHWGNVLLTSVDKNKILSYRLDGKEIEVESCGVEVGIIDFTLSRMEVEGVVIFNDLSEDDELFIGKEDYQFEVYRLMQKNNGNEWRHYKPYTNILWLHYLLDKAPQFRYKNPKSKTHKDYLIKLRKIKDFILCNVSVRDFVLKHF